MEANKIETKITMFKYQVIVRRESGFKGRKSKPIESETPLTVEHKKELIVQTVASPVMECEDGTLTAFGKEFLANCLVEVVDITPAPEPPEGE